MVNDVSAKENHIKVILIIESSRHVWESMNNILQVGERLTTHTTWTIFEKNMNDRFMGYIHIGERIMYVDAPPLNAKMKYYYVCCSMGAVRMDGVFVYLIILIWETLWHYAREVNENGTIDLPMDAVQSHRVNESPFMYLPGKNISGSTNICVRCHFDIQCQHGRPVSMRVQ